MSYIDLDMCAPTHTYEREGGGKMHGKEDHQLRVRGAFSFFFFFSLRERGG